MKQLRLRAYKFLLIMAGCIAATVIPHQAHALKLPPFEDGTVSSLQAYRDCQDLEDGNFAACTAVAVMADPPAPGITSISMTVQYDTNMFSFNEQKSGFLCQFSQDGDCPPVGAAAGTFPLGALPSSGFNPGNELPDSSVTLTDAMGEVSLNYLLASPVTTPTETNFFLYFFDFKNPLLIDVSRTTATYFSSGSGSHFNQTDFACITTDRQGCGSDNGISGITESVARTH